MPIHIVFDLRIDGPQFDRAAWLSAIMGECIAREEFQVSAVISGLSSKDAAALRSNLRNFLPSDRIMYAEPVSEYMAPLRLLLHSARPDIVFSVSDDAAKLAPGSLARQGNWVAIRTVLPSNSGSIENDEIRVISRNLMQAGVVDILYCPPESADAKGDFAIEVRNGQTRDRSRQGILDDALSMVNDVQARASNRPSMLIVAGCVDTDHRRGVDWMEVVPLTSAYDVTLLLGDAAGIPPEVSLTCDIGEFRCAPTALAKTFDRILYFPSPIIPPDDLTQMMRTAPGILVAHNISTPQFPRMAQAGRDLMDSAIGLIAFGRASEALRRECRGDRMDVREIEIPWPARLPPRPEIVTGRKIVLYSSIDDVLLAHILSMVDTVDASVDFDGKRREVTLLLQGQAMTVPDDVALSESLKRRPIAKRTGRTLPNDTEEALATVDLVIDLRNGDNFELVRACRHHGLPLLRWPQSGDIKAFSMQLRAWLEYPSAYADRSLARQNDGWEYAREMREAVEGLYDLSPELRRLKSIASLAFTESRTNVDPYARSQLATALLQSVSRLSPEILVDVSVLAQYDQATGIQRVVRAIVRSLISQPPSGWRIAPVTVDLVEGRYVLRRAGQIVAAVTTDIEDLDENEFVEPRRGDIFLGLDLNTAGLVGLRDDGLLDRWSVRGVDIQIIVYDLLPIEYPHYFPEPAAREFAQWLSVIAKYATKAHCISAATRGALETWFDRESPDIRPSTYCFTMGADMEASSPTRGMSAENTRTIEMLKQQTFILMVGTIEPRKGHADVIRAMEVLWQNGCLARLVILGKSGWLVDELMTYIHKHPESDKRLLCLSNVTDEMLEHLYQNASGMVFAAANEGYGLPIVEAACYDLPLLLRDIPVFREVAGENACYFSSTEPSLMASDTAAWLEAIIQGTTPRSGRIVRRTWEESANSLLCGIFDGNVPSRVMQ